MAIWNRRAMPWVAVAERLPEPEQLCLWWNANESTVHFGTVRQVTLRWYTHWLPLSDDFFPAVDKLAQRKTGEQK